jgi:PhnB protein
MPVVRSPASVVLAFAIPRGRLYDDTDSGKDHPMAVNAIPDGYSTVTPYIIVDGASDFIAYVQDVFGGRERTRMPMANGRIGHAEIQLGSSIIMTADSGGFWEARPAMLHVYVEDVDAQYERAMAAGGTSRMAPATQFYGDRSAIVEDRWGNQWSLATHVEDVSDEEMERRVAEWNAQNG